MGIAFLIGRIILGVYYLYNARNHFLHGHMMAPYAESHGVPLPKAVVPASGVLLLIGGLSILTGVLPVVGVAAVLLFLVPVSLMMHNFWAIQDPMQRMSDTINFAKNMALVGAALMFLAIPQPWPISL